MNTLRNKVSLIGKVLAMGYTEDPIPTIDIVIGITEKKAQSSFHIVGINKIATIANKHLVPGTSVLIEGSLIDMSNNGHLMTIFETMIQRTGTRNLVQMHEFLILPKKKKKK
jgi:hypothetical protein